MALRTGYGTGAYGDAKYGVPVVYEAAVAASGAASASLDAERVRLAHTSAEGTGVSALAGERVALAAVSGSSGLSSSMAGFTAIVGALSAFSGGTPAITYLRLRPFAISAGAASVAALSARKKWEDEADVTAPTWTDAAYRSA